MQKKESGQVLAAGIFILIILLLLIFAGFDSYNALRAKFKLETAQEAAALAGAAWQRDSLNLIGEINLIKACSILLEGDENWVVPLPEKVPENSVNAEANKILRRQILQSRLDVLTEMQSRISFVGPLIGLAAAQQAAKANGLPVMDDFEHYIYNLHNSTRYREEFGGAATHIHNYAWKQPYIDLIQTISRNGVSVLPNALYTTTPRVYPPQLGIPAFYNAILSKYEEIKAAEGEAVYPQSSWSLMEEFVYKDKWSGRFAHPPWWDIEYNHIAFPDESEIFTLGVSTTGDTAFVDEKWRETTINKAKERFSPENLNAIYDPQNNAPVPDDLSMKFFSYDSTWYPSYYRQKYDDYDENHYNYWFHGEVLRKKVKPCYRYEGPAAYVESRVELGKTTSIIKVTGQSQYSNTSIHIGSNREANIVSDFSDYRPGTIAKTLGALNEDDPPIALPVILPVFDRVVVMPTYMPIPYNFNVLRKNDSALNRFLMWLSTKNSLNSNDNLPAGCEKYLDALRILTNGPGFRYYGWNPQFNESEFDAAWRGDLAKWQEERKKDPSSYQYNVKKGLTLPGYLQEPNIFTACPNTTARSGIVMVKEFNNGIANGKTAARHFIGNGRYMVVNSAGHIINRMEADPTWDPNCCGVCKCSGGGGSGPWFGFNVSGNKRRGPPRM